MLPEQHPVEFFRDPNGVVDGGFGVVGTIEWNENIFDHPDLLSSAMAMETLSRPTRYARYDSKEALFCKRENRLRFTNPAILSIIARNLVPRAMPPAKNKYEARLQELILEAKRLDIEVRSEKLLREAGYRTKSGSCRVKGQQVILLDRDTRVSEQIEFLAGELAARQGNSQPSD